MCLMLKTLGKSLTLTLFSVSMAINVRLSSVKPKAIVSCCYPKSVLAASSLVSSPSYCLPSLGGGCLIPSLRSLSRLMYLTSPTLSATKTPSTTFCLVSPLTIVTSVNFFFNHLPDSSTPSNTLHLRSQIETLAAAAASDK